MLGDEPAAVVEGDDLVAFLRRVARRLVGAELQRDRARRIRDRADRRRNRRRPTGARRAREGLRRRRLRDGGARRDDRLGAVRGAVGIDDAGGRGPDAAAVEIAHHVGLGDAPLRTRAAHAVEIDAVLLRHVADHGAGALVPVAARLRLLLCGRGAAVRLGRRRRRGLLGRRRPGALRGLLLRRPRCCRRLRTSTRGRAGVVQARQRAAHLHHRAFLRDDFHQHAGGRRGDLRVRLVGGDLDQWLVALDPLSRLRQPLHDRALDH